MCSLNTIRCQNTGACVCAWSSALSAAVQSWGCPVGTRRLGAGWQGAAGPGWIPILSAIRTHLVENHDRVRMVYVEQVKTEAFHQVRYRGELRAVLLALTRERGVTYQLGRGEYKW